MITEIERHNLVDAVKSYVAKALKNITEKLGELERKIAQIQAGPPGPKGDRGDPGEGVTGPQGPEGPAGKDADVNYPVVVAEVLKLIPQPKDGRDGREGKDGQPGKDGLPGKDGQPGKDAVIDYGYIIDEVLRRMPMPKDGSPGPQGEPGKDGQSIIGPQGPEGRPGKDVEINYPSIVAEVLKQIPPPKDGASGRDALQIDILSSVDLSRSYPRGTFARYDGGIIRSFRDTVPGDTLEKSGWEVVLLGIAEISARMSPDCRTIAVITRATGREATETAFGIPAMVYRGIFDSTQKYVQGDVVTWDGSAWHCQRATLMPPSRNNESDWKLMVKEGRKGKDGKDGPEGKQGPPGRPGMDSL